ncbi:MAG: TM2 domain-containing protein [Lachnospiraceae bacterium]|jgi:TM2 domain-containing membrane protein YozV|nr:TM2 domain-containing protein [Lachnospiraceae bacterium]
MENQKSKMVAGLLGIFLGAFGVHKFYLGYTKEAVIMLVISLLSLGTLAAIVELIGFIEGIIYITKSDEDFQSIYVDGHKGWF